MAFGKRRWTTRTKAIVALFALAGIGVPILGPFTFYGTLIPYLTPIIPKPAGVPIDADAAHDWKGPGLYWRWERELPSGRAKWSLAEDRWVWMGFYARNSSNAISAPLFAFANYGRDEIDFSHASSGASHCSIHTAKISAEDINVARKLLAEASVAAKGDVERRLITLSQNFLDQPVPKLGEDACAEN